MVRTAGCLDRWTLALSAGGRRVTAAGRAENPETIAPG